MKSRKLLIAFGLVLAIPGFLAILPTTVGPVSMPQDSVVEGYEEGPLCPGGGFCGVDQGPAPGCTYIPCCPEGQHTCDELTRVGYPFQKIVKSSVGQCWVAGDFKDACLYSICGGTTFCSDPQCGGIADDHINERLELVQHGPCVGSLE